MKGLSSKLILLVLALIYWLILSGCDREPVKVGLMVDLTGRASDLGISGRNAAEIAAEEINSQGGIKGRKLKLIIKDDKGFPSEAAKVDKELVKEGIVAGVGHLASGTGLEGLKVFSEAGLIMLSPTMSTENLSGKDDNLIRIIGSNRKQGELLASAALKNGQVRSVAILCEYNNRAYTQEVCKYFKQMYEANGGKVVFEDSFTSTPGMDFNDIAQKVLNSGAEGALIVAGGMDLAIITQKVRKQRPDMEIYAGMWAMTGDLLTNGGKAAEGIYLPGVYDSRNDRPEFVRFKAKYYERFKAEPTFASVYAYEAVKLLADALEKSEKFDTNSIKKAIIETGSYKGLQDDYYIDRYGDTDRDYFLFRVKGADFQREK